MPRRYKGVRGSKVKGSRSQRGKDGNNRATRSQRGHLTAEEMEYNKSMANTDYEYQKSKMEHDLKMRKEVTKRKALKYGATSGSIVGTSATQNVADIADGGIGERDSNPNGPNPVNPTDPNPNPNPNPNNPPAPRPKPKPAWDTSP